MTTQKIDADLVLTSIQPIRVAWLFDNTIPQLISELVTLNTRLWGGLYNVFIPFIDGGFSDFWKDFLKAYDPDFLINTTNSSTDLLKIKINSDLELFPFNIYDYSEIKERFENNTSKIFSLGMNSHLLKRVENKPNIFSNLYEIVYFNPDDNNPLYHFLLAYSGRIDNFTDKDRGSNQIEIPPAICFPKIKENKNFLSSDDLSQVFQRLLTSFMSTQNFFTNSDGEYVSYRIIPLILQNIKFLIPYVQTDNHKIPSSFLELSLDGSNHFILFLGEMNDVDNFAIFWIFRMLYRNVIWIPISSDRMYLNELLKTLNVEYFSKTFESHDVYLASKELEKIELEFLTHAIKPRFPKDMEFKVIFHQESKRIPIIHSQTVNSPNAQLGYFINGSLSLSNPILNEFLNNISIEEGSRAFIVEIHTKNLSIANKSLLIHHYIDTVLFRSRISNNKIRFLFNDFFIPDIKYLEMQKGNLPINKEDLYLKIKRPKALDILNGYLRLSTLSNYSSVSLSSIGRYNQQIEFLFGSVRNFLNDSTDITSRLIIRSFLYDESDFDKRIDQNKQILTYSEIITSVEHYLFLIWQKRIKENQAHFNNLIEDFKRINTNINFDNYKSLKELSTDPKFKTNLDGLTSVWERKDPLIKDFFRKFFWRWMYHSAEKINPNEKFGLMWRIENFIEDFSFFPKFSNVGLNAIIKFYNDNLTIIDFENNPKAKLEYQVQVIKNQIHNLVTNKYEPYQIRLLEFLITYIENKPKKSRLNEVKKIEGHLEWLKIFFHNLSIYPGLIYEADESSINKKLSNLIERQIILQGLKLYCKTCLHENWYPLLEITDSFVCKRCLSKSALPPDPEFAFRLNEVVFQGIIHYSYITFWALDWLQRNSQKPLVYSHEFQISFLDRSETSNRKEEVDIFCIRNGNIVLGEVKKDFSNIDNRELVKIEKFIIEVKPDEFYFIFNRES